jgi:hypothetical protein
MATELEILFDLCEEIKINIQKELESERRSRAYDGTPKPVKGGYVGALSNRITTGTLFESVTVKPVETQKGFDIEVTFPGADYWKWVNFGRRGKNPEIVGNSPTVKYPPLQAIEDWIAEKGLPQFRDRRGRFISNKKRAFLIQRSIGEYGIFPTLFVNEGIQKSENAVKFFLVDYGRAVVKSNTKNFR